MLKPQTLSRVLSPCERRVKPHVWFTSLNLFLTAFHFFFFFLNIVTIMQYKKPTFNRVAFSEHHGKHEYLHDWTIEGSSLAFWQHFNPAGGFLASNLGGHNL